MKIVRAKVVFEYNFTEMIQMMNRERTIQGEPAMTDAEIQEELKMDILSFEFRPSDSEISIEISEN